MDITLSLNKTNHSISGSIQEWWIVNETKPGPLNMFKDGTGSGLEIYIFSDQVSPPSLGFLAGYG